MAAAGPPNVQLASAAGVQQLNSTAGLQHIALTNLQQLQQLSLAPQLALQLGAAGQIGTAAAGPIGGQLGGLAGIPAAAAAAAAAGNGINSIPVMLREGQRTRGRCATLMFDVRLVPFALLIL